MNPITLVVTAVALGAAAGLTETATTAVRDAYAGLKSLLAGRRVDVSGVERKPGSAAQQAALEEILADAGDVVDDEMLVAARRVTGAVAEHAPDVGRVVGVELRDVQAEFVRIGSVISAGDGVRMQGVRLTGGFTAEDVRVGGEQRPPSGR